MDAATVSMYLSQIDSIKSQEALENVLQLQIGYGLMKKQEADQQIQKWRRLAERGTERKRARNTGTPPGLGVKTNG